MKKSEFLDFSMRSPQVEMERPSPTNGSHAVALTQSSMKKRSNRENILILSTDIHLTVRIGNRSLTRRHLRLILDVLLYEIFLEGITLERYLLLVHLYQNLLGQKTEPLDLAVDHERRLCLLSEIIMLDLSDKDFCLGDPIVVLSEELRKEVLSSDLIMSNRTYNSRKYHWAPEKWLTVRPVGIDTLIERSGNSQRYSSYCKGYGESHPSAHLKKTKSSVELDGEDAKEPQVIRLSELSQLLILNRLRLKPKRSRSHKF
jgi:hypothetical protein